MRVSSSGVTYLEGFFQTVRKKYGAVKALNPPQKKLERFIESDFRPEKFNERIRFLSRCPRVRWGFLKPTHWQGQLGKIPADIHTLGATLTLHTGTWSHSCWVC